MTHSRVVGDFQLKDQKITKSRLESEIDFSTKILHITQAMSCHV